MPQRVVIHAQKNWKKFREPIESKKTNSTEVMLQPCNFETEFLISIPLFYMAPQENHMFDEKYFSGYNKIRYISGIRNYASLLKKSFPNGRIVLVVPETQAAVLSKALKLQEQYPRQIDIRTYSISDLSQKKVSSFGGTIMSAARILTICDNMVEGRLSKPVLLRDADTVSTALDINVSLEALKSHAYHQQQPVEHSVENVVKNMHGISVGTLLEKVSQASLKKTIDKHVKNFSTGVHVECGRHELNDEDIFDLWMGQERISRKCVYYIRIDCIGNEHSLQLALDMGICSLSKLMAMSPAELCSFYRKHGLNHFIQRMGVGNKNVSKNCNWMEMRINNNIR
jgi:hypothetical protein